MMAPWNLRFYKHFPPLSRFQRVLLLILLWWLSFTIKQAKMKRNNAELFMLVFVLIDCKNSPINSNVRLASLDAISMVGWGN